MLLLNEALCTLQNVKSLLDSCTLETVEICSHAESQGSP